MTYLKKQIRTTFLKSTMQKTRKNLMSMVRKRILGKRGRDLRNGVHTALFWFIENVAKQMVKIHFFRLGSKYDTSDKIG